MITLSRRLSQGALFIAALGLTTSCGLPRSGPNKDEIYAGSVLREGDAYVFIVDDRVNQIAGVAPSLGFTSTFLNAGVIGSDTIRAGDTLALQVWENVSDGLLAGPEQSTSRLDEVQVDDGGFIFVPYAGRIRAADNTPDALRRIITEKLQEQTPEPQVQVIRLAGDGSTVSIVGGVGAQGVYPIERPTRTLSAMIARAGGIAIRPEVAQITVVRGNERGSVWFQDIFISPNSDIALRPGDRIVVEEDTRSFTALGATGAQNEVTFQSQTISAIEAIAQVGGLNSTVADPTGVFVFRNEPEEIARLLTGDTTLIGTQRVIYALDLTRPNGMFMARDFAIRDDDTVYVTEAPFVQFDKTIAAITGSLGRVGTTANTLAGN